MDNTTTKPITLLRNDFASALVELCNTSGLPFFVIESVLKDIIQEVHVASLKQYEKDRDDYIHALETINQEE